MSGININPSEGNGNAKAFASSGLNDGLDKSVNYTISENSGDKSKNVTINQLGRREKFFVKNGDSYEEFITSDEGTFNVIKDGARGACASWENGQLPPEAISSIGDGKLLPKWDFYLVDMTANTGYKVKPVGKLMKNNLLRFENGDFAPTVGITEEMKSGCDVDLYLDGGHSLKYCNASEFDPVSFYEKYGISQKLYNVSGEEVRVLRPWETTSKDYSIFIGNSKGLYVLDKVLGKSGNEWSGVYVDDVASELDGIDVKSSGIYLPPTGISPSPVCSVNGKSRSFFYLYEGEVNCKSSVGAGNSGNMFANGRTYPLVLNSAISYMQKARANNSNIHAPYPFAEGGYFALNAYICYIESLYGNKNIHDGNFFGSGISNNNSISNESQLMTFGGLRYKIEGEQDWHYSNWGTSNFSYSHGAGKTHWSNIINSEYPKEQCMESQMAVSFAIETGVREGDVFEFYGGEYWYKKVPGSIDNDMNFIVYKKMSGVYSLYKEKEDEAPVSVTVEVVLRMSLFGGMNLSGDVFRYWQGGYEQVGTLIKQIDNSDASTRKGHPVKIYMNPDQKEWSEETIVQKNDGTAFSFESSYPVVGESVISSNGYAKRRMPLSAWKTESGGNISQGECFFAWEECRWASPSTPVGAKARVAARFGGYANASNCSARSMSAYDAVSYAARNFAGSVQCLLDLDNAV